MSNINAMLDWMQQRQGKVNYQLGAWGPSKYDCSSAVYSALIAGGFLSQGTRGYTDTLFGDLERNGWKQIFPDGSGNIPTKRGDIFIWGERGNSANEAGHTGIFVDDQDNIIHCNFGYDGITVNDHDTIWDYNGRPYITVYRYKGATENKPTPPTSSKHRHAYKVDDIQFINGLWQIRCNSLAPAGFDWTDNGINATDIDMIDPSTGAMLADQETIRPGMYFAFNENRVADAGEVVKDHGYNYRKFNFASPTGVIWLVRDSKQQLVYGEKK